VHRHGRAAICHAHSFIAFAHFYLRQRLSSGTAPPGGCRRDTARTVASRNFPKQYQHYQRATSGPPGNDQLTIILFKEFVAKDATLASKII